MKKILEIKNLYIRFKFDNEFVRVIHGISFDLEKGKSLGIVGESGCGKSITASSIMKLLPSNCFIESGEIIYNGDNLVNYDNEKIRRIRGNKIALIPQDPLTSLNPLYTVGDQISEVIELHKKLSKKEAKQLTIDLLKQVKIPDAESRFNSYPHEFSGGMMQRAIIAMALSCNPELIIADEPTTALDVTVQAQILDLIRSMQKKYNTSMLLITHDLGVISETCDQVAIMYAGRIVEHSDVKSIFDNPMHPYTRGLLDSLPVGKVERLKTIEGQPPELADKIPGCQFYPRCSSRIDICKDIEPELIDKGNSHKVRCHLYRSSCHCEEGLQP